MEQLKKCMIQNMDLKKEYFKDLDNETNYSHKAMAILNCIIQEISETYFKMCKATNKKVNQNCWRNGKIRLYLSNDCRYNKCCDM